MDYSINLYYPVGQIEAVLRGVAAIADPSVSKPMEIEFPNQRRITIPNLACNSEDSPIKISDPCNEGLDTVLLFPPDDDMKIWGFTDKVAKRFRDSADLVSVGYIYLGIGVGNEYAEFGFGTPGSSMSCLFKDSLSVHRRFIELMQSTGGLFGLIDVEEPEYLLLTNPAQTITGCEREYDDDKGCYTDIDKFVKSCLDELQRIKDREGIQRLIDNPKLADS